MTFSRHLRLLAVLLLLGTATGCLFRSSRPAERRLTTATLLEAEKSDLVERINRDAARITTMNATVDITPTVGGARKGKITEYKDIRGYVLLRKPDMLRMIGLLPIVRNRAFDMVSDGDLFRLWIPPRNRFIVGRNDVVKPSPQTLENLRPRQIMDALLVREIDPEKEITFLEQGWEVTFDPQTRREVEQPNYILNVVRWREGAWLLSRKVVFSRIDLEPSRQIVYDDAGNVATDARYSRFLDYDGVRFPSLIEIWRPQEEYNIVLAIQRLRLNEPLTDDQFHLEQPEGVQVVRLEEEPEAAARAPGQEHQGGR
jgi:outer membrane lipoprotein-sorting protein